MTPAVYAALFGSGLGSLIGVVLPIVERLYIEWKRSRERLKAETRPTTF